MKLAEDIIAHGLSPIDALLVLQEGSSPSYTVLEGNRRVAALKLLANPELAKDHPVYRDRLKKLAKGVTIPYTARCFVTDRREDAKHWQSLRHGGERAGVGVVPWSSEAAHRFAGRQGSQVDRGVAFVEAIAKAFSGNQALQTNLALVRKARITTLGRLVSDPSFRDRFGVEFSAGGVQSHYPAEALEGAVSKIFEDLAGPVSVSELKTKEQRQKYLGKLKSVMPDSSAYASEASPLSGAKPPKSPAVKKPAKPPALAPKALYGGVQLTNLGERVASLLRELQQLDVDQFPNAAAALNRVLMELAVGQVHVLKKRPEPSSLRDGVRYCLTQIDPKGKESRYQSVRAGLNDGTSMLAVKTMQALVHNPHWNPTPSEVRTIASNYSAFLTALDTLV